MKILKKEKNSIQIICFPEDVEIQKGDYLIAEEGNGKYALLQVIDVNYVQTPGILEDLLRTMSLEKMDTNLIDPFDTNSFMLLIKDARIVSTKIRAIAEGENLIFGSSWLPSRFKSFIRKADINTLYKLIKVDGYRKINIGKVSGQDFYINAEAFDGRLTIITGKKETGKSHIAKIIVSSLIEYGAKCIVFDINGEYVNLNKNKLGEPSKLANKIKILIPGENFKVTIKDAGLKVLLDVLEYVYNTPGTSCREFARIWHTIEHKKISLTIEEIIEFIQKASIHESVRDALISRMLALKSSRFFTNNENEATSLMEEINSIDDGTLIIIDMKSLIPITRKIVVEYILSKLGSLLKDDKIPPIFLLAEEAHLYIRNTYWDDLVTRMRHFGLFPIFVTNQPDSIPETIYRQADNIFLFNFTNENDLDFISKASRIDSESIKSIVSQLPPKHCFILGYVVGDLPVVVKVKDMDIQTMGMTKNFFKERKSILIQRML
jgi:DNA helicase HerA-like ATPase